MYKDQIVLDRQVGHYLTHITKILDKYLSDRTAKVYLYGSRARGQEHAASDIDLVIKSPDLFIGELAKIREAFFESHIPYKVDLVNWDAAGEELKKSIINEGVLIWES